jgi:hypothetical protein
MLRLIFLRYPIKTRRLLEILPGAFSWSLILFPIWGSFLVPTLVAYFVIAFAVYWLYRSLTLSIFAIFAHFRVQASMKYDWLAALKKTFPAQYSELQHVVVIPTYQEPVATLQRTLHALQQQTIPLKQLHIMISFEEREGPSAVEKSNALKKQFKGVFGDLWTTLHPDIQGEIKGKSSNTAWGARQAKKELVDTDGVPIELITITSEDADALFDKQYFAALTFQFLKDPTRAYNKIWQGGIVFYNNIWKVFPPIRVLAAIFSVTQLYVLMRRDRLINFSTYSTTLKHIDEIGYWDTDVIPEDYRLFFKSYFAKKGDFEVEPIFLPIYADAPESNGFFNSMVNQYEQLKRWAWGVSDDAYIIRQYIITPGLPFWDKTIRVLKVLEDHFLWPVNWFAVTLAAFFPPLFNPAFSRTVLGSQLPQTTSTLLTLSLVSLVVIFVIDAANRPPRPHQRKWLSYIMQPLEFLMLPIIGFFFSALPGIDAHTRLMLGKYIEYKVTEKV